MHAAQRLAVNLRVGNENALGNQRLVLLFEVDVEFRTDEGHDGFLVGFGTHDEHLVAQVEHGVAVGDDELAI